MVVNELKACNDEPNLNTLQDELGGGWGPQCSQMVFTNVNFSVYKNISILKVFLKETKYFFSNNFHFLY